MRERESERGKTGEGKVGEGGGRGEGDGRRGEEWGRGGGRGAHSLAASRTHPNLGQ